jgi:hypothetical protein
MGVRGKHARSSSASATSFLQKAEQFLSEGRTALAAGSFDAALLLAVHAAISANDAATSHIAQIRSTDPDHLTAADLLASVSGDVAKARQLRALISLKHEVEYQSSRTPSKTAKDGIVRAERFVGWVSQLVR